MDEKELIQESHKVLNRLIFKSRQFCNKYCVPDGLSGILMVYNNTGAVFDDIKFSNKLGYDYDYFAFVKKYKNSSCIETIIER